MPTNEPKEKGILLVEDSEADAALLLREFKRANLANPVCWLSSGEEAIRYLSSGMESGEASYKPPGVLLLDIHMPGIDGFEVLRWVRKQPHLKNVLIIMISEMGDVKKIHLAYELGASSYLTKPLNSSDLANMIGFFKGYWTISERPLGMPKPKAI